MNNNTPYFWLNEFCKKNDFPFRDIHSLRNINHMKTSLLNHTHKITTIPLPYVNRIKTRDDVFQVEKQHMENIIDIIYDSNLLHMSDISEIGKEYNDAMKRLRMIDKKMLEQHLEIKDIFDEYQSATIDICNLANRHEFTKGMRTVAQITLEITKPIK